MEIEAYRQFADLEEDHWWFRGRRKIFFDLLDSLVPRERTLQVLDVGSGAGGFLSRLVRYGRARGLEISPEISAVACERTGLPILCASAYAIPLADRSQDLVCLFDTLEHMPDEERALGEIVRVLRPGGLAFFSVPAYQFLYANNDRVAHHCRRYTRGRLVAALERANLEIVRATYFNTLLFPVILPAILLLKVWESMGRSDPNRTNLTVRTPRALSSFLYHTMSSERHALRWIDFPVGHSLIAVARRPDPGSRTLQ